MIQQSSATKDALVSAATAQFALHGFAGVSIATIAADVGVSKQALLHHFKTKDGIYDAVLADVSERFLIALEPKADLEEAFARFSDYAMQKPQHMQLIVRELLDQPGRAGADREWVLAEFVERLTELAKKRKPKAKRPEVTCAIFTVLAGISAYAASGPVLQDMLGDKRYARTKLKMPETVQALVSAHFA